MKKRKTPYILNITSYSVFDEGSIDGWTKRRKKKDNCGDRPLTLSVMGSQYSILSLQLHPLWEQRKMDAKIAIF